MDRPEVSIIGAGALGSTLADALFQKNITVKSLYNRNPELLSDLAERTGATYSASFPSSQKELGTLIFLTVADDAIQAVASRLATLADSFEGYTVAHCSGNKTTSVLSDLAEKEAEVAAFHPLQTFTQGAGPHDFKDIYFDIEGDRQAVSLLADVAGLLGARWFEITAEQKPWLHASAVMASNYLIALLETAGKIAAQGGMDEQEVRTALLPLIIKSLNNASAENLSDVLTGPVARGDAETVKNHLAILQKNPLFLTLYKQLGQVALSLARKDDKLGSEAEQALKVLFETDG